MSCFVHKYGTTINELDFLSNNVSNTPYPSGIDWSFIHGDKELFGTIASDVQLKVSQKFFRNVTEINVVVVVDVIDVVDVIHVVDDIDVVDVTDVIDVISGY